MITRLSHTPVWVTDMDQAYDFYVNKLGFTVNTDATMDNGFRWLTVSPSGQPDLEITIMKIEAGMSLDEEQAAALKKLVASGAMGAGVFHTDDCRATFAELSAKGVKFKSEPEEQFYGTEAIMSDPFGNWFSLTTPKEH
ncbi:MAG: VOC family protein [Fimbriimonadaceae bacterium]|nr:VOC family protein [Fimbriimonadaceae bacterium]